MLNKQRIAVTGASGFLGRYFVRELLAQGAEVVAVVRNPGKVPELHQPGVMVKVADLAEPERMAEAFAGCDAVVANAGQVSLSNQFEQLLAQNLQGTANTLRACAAAGVPRVVSLSSASVYRQLRADRGLTEDAPLRGLSDARHRFSVYAISKACAEQEAWRLAGELGLALTTLRPYAIFGAFDQNSFSLWFERLMRLPLTPFPRGLNLPMVYAGDLAKALCLTLQQPATEGLALNVAGEELDFWAFADQWRAAGGFSPRLRLPIPVPFRRRLDDTRLRTLTGWQPQPVVDSCTEILQAMVRGGHFDAALAQQRTTQEARA